MSRFKARLTTLSSFSLAYDMGMDNNTKGSWGKILRRWWLYSVVKYCTMTVAIGADWIGHTQPSPRAISSVIFNTERSRVSRLRLGRLIHTSLC
jgi:hypothetical protein